MTGDFFNDELRRIIKPYHPKPDKWIRFNWSEIKRHVDDDSGETFLGILELFCRKRGGKLRFFFEDYAGYRAAYLNPERFENDRKVPASMIAPDLVEDMGHMEEIRAQGKRYFESDEWQGFKRSMGLIKQRAKEEPAAPETELDPIPGMGGT